MSTVKTISVRILYNGRPAGILEKSNGRYRFRYDSNYVLTAGNRPVSITMPFSTEVYESNMLFPVFVNMLSEGANKRMQCRMMKIDENDYFSLLIATAKEDSIGPITIEEIHESA